MDLGWDSFAWLRIVIGSCEHDSERDDYHLLGDDTVWLL
jgi:hypothetical protein